MEMQVLGGTTGNDINTLDYLQLEAYAQKLVAIISNQLGVMVNEFLDAGVIPEVFTVVNPLTNEKKTVVEVRLSRDFYETLAKKEAEYRATQPVQ